MDISNGVGIGASVFLSGCHFHCKNCHNQELWDFNSGYEYDSDAKNKILKTIQPEWIERFSALGGEPLETVNLKELLSLLENIKILKFGFIQDILMNNSKRESKRIKMIII